MLWCRESLNLKDKRLGLSLIELLLVITLITFLGVALMLSLDPVSYRAKARDEKRLTDMTTLDRVINEYKMDTGFYPDQVDTLRISTSLPSGNSGPLESTQNGWIDVDLSSYTSKLPTDPVNDLTYYYSYQHTSTGYEINAVLEHLVEYMQNDGGTSNAIYEIGNNLSIL